LTCRDEIAVGCRPSVDCGALLEGILGKRVVRVVAVLGVQCVQRVLMHTIMKHTVP
jgi:hypothetical protein